MSHGPLDAGGADVGGGEDGGGEVGGGVDGAVDGLGEPETLPVQVVPLSANAVGTGLLPFHEPLNPTLALPPVGMLPFHDAFVTVTCAPDWVTLPFQSWVIVCPAVKLHVSRHSL